MVRTESAAWRVERGALLERELDANTFATGINRELASEYHGFVAVLGLVAAVEARRGRAPSRRRTWRVLRHGRRRRRDRRRERGPPAAGRRRRRQGARHRRRTRDDGRRLLATGRALFGPAPVVACVTAAVRSTLLAVRCWPRTVRPAASADSGRALRRRRHHGAANRPRRDGRPEIWCRCDGGPHGFLSIAAHAHADALSVEVRHGGVDVLADPGTYCYHGEPAWRSYFRSTLAHNTVELAGRDQSRSGGPFLWATAAAHACSRGRTRRGRRSHLLVGGPRRIPALDPAAVHRRSVRLDGATRRVTIVDTVESGAEHELLSSFHLGPAVTAVLSGGEARLEWPGRGLRATTRFRATLTLPPDLDWSMHRGQEAPVPVRGWYSPAFGVKTPSITLVGQGRAHANRPNSAPSWSFMTDTAPVGGIPRCSASGRPRTLRSDAGEFPGAGSTGFGATAGRRHDDRPVLASASNFAVGVEVVDQRVAGPAGLGAYWVAYTVAGARNGPPRNGDRPDVDP